MRFTSSACTAAIAIYVPVFTSGFSPAATFSRSLLKNFQSQGTTNVVDTRSTLCTCPACAQLPVEIDQKRGCCFSCQTRTQLRMSSIETDDEEIPPEVAAIEGSPEEAHNMSRPARSSISRNTRAPRGKPLSELSVGATVDGTVKGTTSYGAFVNIGYSSDALLHVSRLSDDFVSNVEDIVKTGDKVTVRVLSVDIEKGQVAVTMRSEEAEAQAQSSRQENQGRQRNDRSAQTASLTALSESNFDDSKFFEGEVVSTPAFGAFVRFDMSLVDDALSGQLEGLAHVSVLAEERTENVNSICKVGDKVQVRLRAVDAENSRISLSMISKEAEEANSSRKRGGGGGGGFENSGELFMAHELGSKDWAETSEKILEEQQSFKNSPVIIDRRKKVEA